jgi:hypothetical protein
MLHYLTFCWPCIVVHQYNKTNVMHFLFNLWIIRGPPHVLSITCSSSGGAAQVTLGILHACYAVGCTCDISSVVCAAPPEDEQVMPETCGGPLILHKLNKKCIKLVFLYRCCIISYFPQNDDNFITLLSFCSMIHSTYTIYTPHQQN